MLCFELILNIWIPFPSLCCFDKSCDWFVLWLAFDFLSPLAWFEVDGLVICSSFRVCTGVGTDCCFWFE